MPNPARLYDNFQGDLYNLTPFFSVKLFLAQALYDENNMRTFLAHTYDFCIMTEIVAQNLLALCNLQYLKLV